MLRRSPWELLLFHLLRSSASSTRTTRKSLACIMSGIFCSSLCPNCLRPVICHVRKLLGSKVWVVCADLGIKLRGLYLCLATAKVWVVCAPRTVKRGADSMLQVAAKRAKESSARAKCPSVARIAGPGVGDTLLVNFGTYVEATEASKHEISANAYKLGYLDCRNGALPCCPLEHEECE